jgi:uncharacterized protein YxjI
MKLKKIIPLIALFAIVIVGVVCSINISAPEDARAQYFCNNKVFSFDLRVDVESVDGDKLYTINGEIFSAYEDDLKMINNANVVVRETNDIFNLISQNEHVVYSGDELLYRCDGKIKLFADSYVVFDADGNKIAHVDFNIFDTVGIMTDTNGNIIARYDSAWFRRDYVVSVFDKCEIDDESVLMIFASYVSDVRADSAN